MEMVFKDTYFKYESLKIYNKNSKLYKNHTRLIHFISITMAEVFINFMEN